MSSPTPSNLELQRIINFENTRSRICTNPNNPEHLLDSPNYPIPHDYYDSCPISPLPEQSHPPSLPPTQPRSLSPVIHPNLAYIAPELINSPIPQSPKPLPIPPHLTPSSSYHTVPDHPKSQPDLDNILCPALFYKDLKFTNIPTQFWWDVSTLTSRSPDVNGPHITCTSTEADGTVVLYGAPVYASSSHGWTEDQGFFPPHLQEMLLYERNCTLVDHALTELADNGLMADVSRYCQWAITIDILTELHNCISNILTKRHEERLTIMSCLQQSHALPRILPYLANRTPSPTKLTFPIPLRRTLPATIRLCGGCSGSDEGHLDNQGHWTMRPNPRHPPTPYPPPRLVICHHCHKEGHKRCHCPDHPRRSSNCQYLPHKGACTPDHQYCPSCRVLGPKHDYKCRAEYEWMQNGSPRATTVTM